MKVDVLVAEIGSTTTVVNAFHNVESGDPVFYGQGQAPTSVLEGDVRKGLNDAMEDLKKQKGLTELTYKEMLATSSAAGGLKMTVHGLVFDMTARAAKEAALGAGAIIHYVTAGKLRETDLKKIEDIKPNLILLAGGVDYGERETALYNAEQLSKIPYKAPVIYAGNIENVEEIKLIFNDRKLYIVDNVYPKIDELKVEPARKVIQEAFEEHIIHAPGMEHIRDLVTGHIVPTPGAVMECTKLLYEKLGNVITLDVGGATTDLHSVTEDSEEISKILISPEPKAKRTVEGDLGVYVNRLKVIESIGEESIREEFEKEGFDFDEALRNYIPIPDTKEEIALAERLTLEAVLRATERHGGRIRYVYGPSGRTTLAEGKDLTQVKYIVGTGGALVHLPKSRRIMESITSLNETGLLLTPSKNAQILIDNDYIMASLGVLSLRYKEAARKLLEKSLNIKF